MGTPGAAQLPSALTGWQEQAPPASQLCRPFSQHLPPPHTEPSSYFKLFVINKICKRDNNSPSYSLGRFCVLCSFDLGI